MTYDDRVLRENLVKKMDINFRSKRKRTYRLHDDRRLYYVDRIRETLAITTGRVLREQYERK